VNTSYFLYTYMLKKKKYCISTQKKLYIYIFPIFFRFVLCVCVFFLNPLHARFPGLCLYIIKTLYLSVTPRVSIFRVARDILVREPTSTKGAACRRHWRVWDSGNVLNGFCSRRFSI